MRLHLIAIMNRKDSTESRSEKGLMRILAQRGCYGGEVHGEAKESRLDCGPCVNI
jgi:hypothetical protein